MSKIESILAFVAVLLCGGAWAATPVAVWDGDFTSLTKNKVTLANVGASANPVVGESGSAYIEIADTATKGVFVNWDNLYNVADIGFSGKEVTVIVAYSDMPTPATNAKGALFTLTSQATTTSDNNSDWLGVMANSSGQTSAMVGSNSTWTHNSENPKGTFDFSADGQNLRYLAFSYKSSNASSLPTGTQLFQKGTDGTWTQVYGSWGLKGSSADIRGCCIGGPRYVTYAGALQGLKIHKIAVFNSIVGKDDIAAYTFPSDLTNGYQKWAQNPAVLTWTGTTGLLHNGPFALFDCAAGADTATSFTGTATNVKTVPGRYNDNTTPWNVFSSAIDVSPGYVLRFAGTTATKTIDAQWGELNLGGIIVESGATGYKFYSKPTNINTRNTTFGDSQKKRETWYVFNEDFEIQREATAASFTIRGPVNIEVADQKTFTIEYSNPTLQDGATLRMHGLGKMVCPKLVATGNVALDFRDEMFKTRDTAFINGQLQIDGTTKIHFPAGWEAGEAHKLTLCTGDLTGAPSEKSANTVFVGDTETDVYLHYDTANKSVYYTSATLITNYTFTEADKTAVSEFELAQGQVYEYNPNVGEFAEGCVFSGIDGIYAWADAFSTTIKVTKATDSFSLKTGTRTLNKDSAIRDSDASVGGFAVHGKLWNNTPVHNENNSEQSASMTLVSGTGSTADGVKVYFRAPNTYFNSNCGVDAGNKRLTASYFDDGATDANTQWTVGDVTLPQAPCARGWQLRLTHIPYEMYDLYIYFASDQAATDLKATAMALSVNGGSNWKWYAGDPTHNTTIPAAQTNTWKADPYSNGTLTEGTNYIKIRVSKSEFGVENISTLDITHGPRNRDNKIRSGIAGIQIVKVDDDGIAVRKADTTGADWTAANMWTKSDKTTDKTWPTSGVVYAKIDADQTSSITVDGVINANMVTLSNTTAGEGEAAKSFKFLTKEPLAEVDQVKDPEEYVLKSPVDAMDFHGNLYLQSRIRGRIALGDDTTVNFVAGEAGQDTEANRAIETTAFPYEFTGSNNPIKKVGYGTFIVPSSMYDREFSFNEGAIRYEAAGTISGNPTGSGKAIVKAGSGTIIFAGNDIPTGGLEIQSGTFKLQKDSAAGHYTFWDGTARAVSVANGAVLDLNGYEGFKADFTLAGGAILASDDANRDLGWDNASIHGISLDGNATVRAVGDFGILCNGRNETTLALNGHTLTKTGAGIFHLCNTTVDSSETGTIDVQAGTLTIWNNAINIPNVKLKLSTGTAVDLGANLTVGDLDVASNVQFSGSAALTANGNVKITLANKMDMVTLPIHGVTKNRVQVVFNGQDYTSMAEVTVTESAVVVAPALARKNPITGEAITTIDPDHNDATIGLTHVFRGTESGDWATVGNWYTDGTTGWTQFSGSKAPGIAGGSYPPMLFDGALIETEANKTVTISTGNFEGWMIHMALLNGVHVTVPTINKVQWNKDAPMWIIVDETSSLQFNEWGSGNIEGNLSYYVASENGVTWNMQYSKNSTMNYYLKGAGSVKYAAGLSSGTHTLKQCDFAIGEESDVKEVVKKTLISYTSKTGATVRTDESVVVAISDSDSEPVASEEAVTADMDIGTYKITVEDDGVYISYVAYQQPVASITTNDVTTKYYTLNEALENANGAAVTLLAAIESVPTGWTYVKSDVTNKIRKIGDIYYYDNYFNNDTSDKPILKCADGTETSYVSGDTVVIRSGTDQVGSNRTDIYFGSNAFASVCVEESIQFLSGNNVSNAFDGSTITIAVGVSLTLNEGGAGRGVNLGAVTFDTIGEAGTGKVVIQKAVSATSIGGTAKLELSGNATLTVGTALADGRVITSDDTKKVFVRVNDDRTYTYYAAVAQASITIDGETSYYPTIASAITDATVDHLTVVVEGDVTLDAAITVPAGVTLDIGSHTIHGQVNILGAIAGNGTVEVLIMQLDSFIILPDEGYITVSDVGMFGARLYVMGATTKPVTIMKVDGFYQDPQTSAIYAPRTVSFYDGEDEIQGAIDFAPSTDEMYLINADVAVAGFAYAPGMIFGYSSVQAALTAAQSAGGSYANVLVYDETAVALPYAVNNGSLVMAVAKIDEKGYATLAAALSAAQANDTVTLLAANAETVTIPADVTVDVAGFAFTGTVKGSGKIKFAGFAPIKDATDLKTSLQNEAWTGTLVVTQPTTGQIGANDNTVDGSNKTLLNNYGNVNSKIEFLNCTYQSGNNNYFGKSYVDGGAGDVVVQPEIVVTGEFKLNNGYSQTNKSSDLNNYTIFRKLSGTGTITSTYASQLFVILDGSDFTGAINTTHKKFIFGSIDANDRTADGQPAAGAVVIKEGNSVTIGADQNWSASGGITVDGTLVLGAAATATTKAYSIALKGTGEISAKATSASTQMKYVLSNHANFTGSITTEVGAHVMLAPANTTTTSLGFSNCGFISIQSGSATIGNGKTWTGGVKNGNGGVYMAANTTLNVGGAASIVGKLYALNSTIAFANWNSSLTISGNFQVDGAGTRIAISLPNEALDEEKTLISWTGKVNVSGETFTCAHLPEGYELSVEDTCLKLVQIQDLVTERTTEVSNSVSMNSLWIGANGIQKFTGTGGIQTPDLQMRDGSELVIDPIKTPIYVTGSVPTFAKGAKIKLAAEYKKTCYAAGELTLFTWNGTTTATIPEGLFDTTTYPNAVLKQETYTSHRQQQATNPADVTYTRLYVDLNPGVAKKPLTIMPLGDSITEGTSDNGFGNPNYRSYLLKILAAKGYDVKSTGFRCVKNHDAAGVGMPEKWSWHNGVSGQRLCSSSTRAGWRDALEATLDASEIPDIITFKIGTNDENTDVDKLFAEWVDVMKRIIKARPNTKIVVGSIMDIYGATWEDAWNDKLRAAIGFNESTETWNNTPGFPENQVFFADLNKANPRVDEEGNYLRTFEGFDNHNYLHPNWIGHEKNAQCWADAIVAALADEKTLTAKYEPNLKTGALANVAPEYLKGFVKLATFKPDNSAIAKNATPTYAAKANIDSNAKITKVGYYMELKNSRSGNVRWVWVDMDNWNTEEENKVFSKIEIPSAYTYQGEADNLHVDTNDGGIEKIAPDVEGEKAWLQFCRGGAGNGGNVPGAPGNFFGWDWNDQMNDGGSYGIMQLYRVAPTVVEGGVTGDNSRAAQVLMAFNRFTSANGQEIGIGNCAIHGAPKTAANVTTTVNYMMTTDYDRLNLASYDLATIEIWGVVDGTQYVMPDAPALEVEASTADEATAACAVVTDAAADSEAGQGGQAQFLTLKATQVGSSNSWKVQAVVDNTKLPENKKIDDTAVAFANAGGIVKLAGATEKQTIQIPKTSTTAGLYYSVSFGTTLDNHTQESERVLATSGEGTVDIPVPALGNEKVYYIKVKASATK